MLLVGVRDSRRGAVERELKGALEEWMIHERDYLPLPIPPRR